MQLRLQTVPRDPCPNCGGATFTWSVVVVAGPHAPPQPHNRMGLHDVQPLAVLGCADCSETLLTCHPEEVLASMGLAIA